VTQGEGVADKADDSRIKHAQKCDGKVWPDHFRGIEVAEYSHQADDEADYSRHPCSLSGDFKLFVAALPGVFGNQQCSDNSQAYP